MKTLLTLAMTTLMSFQVMAADLKSQDISQWITSMPVLKPWLKQHESEFSANISQPNNPEVVFKESIAALKKAGLYDELNGKVKKLGYSNVEEWNQVTQQVTFAWMALEMNENKAQIDAAKAQFAAMKANPDIPDAQKAMMEQMLAPAIAMVKVASKSSAADKMAVKSHQDELRTLFGVDESQELNSQQK
jgi:hypothetical protein